MAIYSLVRRTTNVTINQSAHTIYTGATKRASVLEVGVFSSGGITSIFGLGFPAAAGITPTSPVLLLAEDSANPVSTVNSALAWATSPTTPTQVLRRTVLITNGGVGVTWTFRDGVVVPISSQFVLQNLAANGAIDSYFVVDEGGPGGYDRYQLRDSVFGNPGSGNRGQWRSAWPEAARDFGSRIAVADNLARML